jgi:isocitrate/isopropylmalate dehydrogenase
LNSQKTKVAVIEGDDAAPEAMRPCVELLDSMGLGIEWIYPEIGAEAEAATGSTFPEAARETIDAVDATYFGSTSGSASRALFYLRWGKETFANVRPCRFFPGANSPLARPDGIDFVIVRENLEDMYLGIEGDLEDLAGFNLQSRTRRGSIADMGEGRYAMKAITREGTERVVRFSFELARKRARASGNDPKLTCTTKYNMLSQSDGYFKEIAEDLAHDYEDVEFNTFIIDDFACRMIREPHSFDVIVMPNLYGDIMSDGAAALVGGLGMAASGCYGHDYAYFESAHGTAPDIAGQNIINPTASLLSGCMMLDYLGFAHAAERVEQAVREVYADGACLTPDQGGESSTTEFCNAIAARLS